MEISVFAYFDRPESVHDWHIAVPDDWEEWTTRKQEWWVEEKLQAIRPGAVAEELDWSVVDES